MEKRHNYCYRSAKHYTISFNLFAFVYKMLGIIYVFCRSLLGWTTPQLLVRISLASAAALPLGITGIIAGHLTGLSRAPAVAAVIPGVLTFIGGLGVYRISKKKQEAISVSLSIISFSFFLLLGSLDGADKRALAETRYQREMARQAVYNEFLQSRIRKSLGIQKAEGKEE